MQLITLEKSQTTKLFWGIIGLLFTVAVVTAEQSDPGVTAAGGLVALVALLPLYLWLLGWSHGLPIWPVFVLVTGINYALPMLQDPESLDAYTATDIITGGISVVGFVLLGTMIWLSMTSRASKAPRTILMIEQAHAVRYLQMFVWFGVLFAVNEFAGWVHFPGNTMQVVRGIAGSLSTMGLFVLAYYHGRGLLNKQELTLFAGGAVLTMMANMTSLMLANAVVPVAMVIFGYMLGSNKIPWRVTAIAFVIMALLHPGKYEMRNIYWSGSAEAKPLTLFTLPGFYWDWIGYGLEEIGGVTGVVKGREEEGGASSVFERAGSLHMLLLVQKKAGIDVPYLNGASYAPIPRLLIPRFIDDQKGISHAGNVMLTVNYGVQTIEQTAGTSIFWGLVPEAYANFGYLGMAGLAVVLALFYGWITNLSVGVPMTSLRFVLGLLIMGAATKADTMGVFITSQFQGIVGVSLAAMLLMRRQPNPFAAESGETERGARSTERGAGKWGSAYARSSYGVTSGMPAPGILSELIEGERQEVADHGRTGRRADGTTVGHPPSRGTTPGSGVLRRGEPAGQVADGEVRLAAGGGVVRTLPIRTPKRIARWMPRRVRAAVAAQYAAEDERDQGTGGGGQGTAADVQTANGMRQEEKQRPRQLAVPYQNYRRYRG
jgi:hypothetical protein